MFDNHGFVRRVGVGVADSQRAVPGTEINKLQAIVEIKQYAIVYDDEVGRRHNTILIQIGDDLYLHPQGEAWAGALQQLRPDGWLAQQALGIVRARATPPPKEDEVDVLPAGSA
jgi:hypothetical protein